MKRLALPIGILLLTAGASTRGFAQRIASVSYIDSCRYAWALKYSTRSVFNLTAPATGCSIESNWGDGSRLDTTAITGNSGMRAHTYAAPGSYTVKTVLISTTGTRIDSLTSTYKIECNFISGFIYKDANSDCIFNSNERTINGLAKIQVDSAGTTIDTVYANHHWEYQIEATSITPYKFTLLNTPAGLTPGCPSSGIISFTYNPAIGSTTQQHFALGCSTAANYDFRLSGWNRMLRGVSSGGSSYITLYAANGSCTPGTGSVTLYVSPKYSVNTSQISPTPASVSGNVITWNIANMVDDNVTALYVSLSPNANTNNGDTACNYAIISGGTDVDPSNNVINVCDAIRSSWDPNEKSVFPTGPVNAGTLLTYTIDFENLGNDTAFNIHVQDTLSQHLDASTFEPIATTHAVVPRMYQAGGNNIIKFDFPGINLEDKSVPSRNKGQVQFRIRLKEGVPAGTTVPNRAGIYFDGNPVVLTNYTNSQIAIPAGVQTPLLHDDIKVFPNPAGATINIQVSNTGWKEAVLSNALGQVISREAISKGNNVMNIGAVPTGIYYLQVKGSAGTVTEKIEKR
jgi:uncharacterized repeat protein (TIGR01451 family)